MSPNNGTATRNRGGWTGASLAYIARVNEVLDRLRDYWPLTLRQCYYQLVAELFIENTLGEYKKLSRLLTKARLADKVPWDAFEDRARSTLHSSGWEDQADFVGDQLADFLEDYRRDLIQTQAAALECWIEKDALSRICHQVAYDYCVPVIVARGFSSVSYVNECRRRIEWNSRRGRPTRILYFGDLDPSGWEMLPAMLRTLRGEMGLGDQVEGERYALTPEQVEAYQLPRSIDAIKEKDSRTRKYRERFGDLAVELDALPPATLQTILRAAIEANLDLSRFEAERREEAAERVQLAGLRAQVCRFISTVTANGEE